VQARRQKIEKQFADASSLLGLRTAEASRLEQARKEVEGHVVALEGQVCALQRELANESARVSELTVKVNDREDELARLKGANPQFSRELVGARKENGHSNGGVEVEKGEALPSSRGTETGAALGVKQRAWDEDSVEALLNGKALENGKGSAEDRLQREAEELRRQLEREKERAEAASQELQGRLAARERELGERLQELRNLEQQLEDEEGDKRRILTQVGRTHTHSLCGACGALPGGSASPLLQLQVLMVNGRHIPVPTIRAADTRTSSTRKMFHSVLCSCKYLKGVACICAVYGVPDADSSFLSPFNFLDLFLLGSFIIAGERTPMGFNQKGSRGLVKAAEVSRDSVLFLGPFSRRFSSPKCT
jgi:hypothetical protein